MRFFIVAIVTTALTSFTAFALAEDTTAQLSPDVFKQCEAKFPIDFKQQLACVKDQVEALDALKQPTTRQIAVEPKAKEEEDAEVPASQPIQATNAVEAEADGAENYCDVQIGKQIIRDSWATCLANEKAAHAAIGDAIKGVDSDIVGDPYAVCRNFVSAFQLHDANLYVPQVPMLLCLKAKAPTRDFAKCYENYAHAHYDRDVKSVPAEDASFVANCFNVTTAGGP
jgi:hypothetical protein